MKWLATVFACLLTVSAYAEEPEVKKLATMNECAEWKTVNKLLMNAYGERPFVIAEGFLNVLTTEDIKKAAHRLVIYLNQETTTFTIVSLFIEDEMACILSSDKNFRPLEIVDGIES